MRAAQPLSLLWPNGRATAAIGRLADDAIADLHLAEIVSAIVGADAPAGRLAARERFAQRVLAELLSDAEVIAYRQAVLTDLLEQPALRERLEAVLPGLEALGDVPRGERYRPTAEPGLERVAGRLIDLELLVDVVSRLVDAFNETPVRSEAFRSVGSRLVERLRCAGLPVCRPEYIDAERRTAELVDAYDPGLALSQLSNAGSIVTNAVCFNEHVGRVWVLTGPNRGGKTTYARAVGLAQVLFQAGLYVPACTARMSPVDAIYTHFPGVESARPGEGRLDEEAVRLAGIFRQATPHSLILLNEVLSGTSTLEALGLAYDAVRGLRLLGARAIYVTHLHELATRVDAINATTGGDGTVGSLVAGVEDERGPGERGHRRTFRICPGKPRGLSYASEIAEQHGISYPQLARLLRDRGLVSGG